MPHPQVTERQLINQFLEALHALPEVRAHAELVEAGPRADAGYDARVDVRVAGRPLKLLIEAKKALYPRDVRQALWQLKADRNRRSETPNAHENVSLLIAEAISPGAKELLREQGVGYYDSGGSLFLPARGVYVYVDKPPPKPLSRSIRSLFSKRRAQVVHALLVRHEDWHGVKGLAEQARVSAATASQVLTELERFDWLESRGQGPAKERHVRDPRALLDGWVEQLALLRHPALRRYYVPSARADGLVEKMAHAFAMHKVDYAITHEAAAQRYSPFLSNVSQVRCRLPTGTAADRAIADLDARVVSEGANLAIVEVKSPDELLFREQMDGIWLASPIQVYLDLMRGEGRAKEMAEHLRRERIRF
jgi:hypothetical protein